jgi:hypothetical protein
VEKPSERRGLSRLMLRFPSARDELRQLYRSDPLFPALCGAYEEALDALKIREKSTKVPADELLDYRQLVIDIESDVCALLPIEHVCAGQQPTGIIARLASRWRAIFRLVWK